MSFEYKKKGIRDSSAWIREILSFRTQTDRDNAILKIKKHPYHFRVKAI